MILYPQCLFLTHLICLGYVNIEDISVSEFLSSVGLQQLHSIFTKEQITLDVLAEMNHNELKDVGITAYGHRHKIVKGIQKLISQKGMFVNLITSSYKTTIELYFVHALSK